MTIQKKDKSTEVVPERDPRADILGKDFKTTILKMLEELRENVGKVKKVTYEQNGNVHTETENLKDEIKKKFWS